MPNFFAVCTPGLEPFTTRELKDLGLQVASSPHSRDSLEGRDEVEEVGGVECRGSLVDLYRANLRLPDMTRVPPPRVFYADTFSDLG
jgi:23S rRNA G2445 N2-methylase RlmL